MRPLAALRTAVAALCRLVTRTEPPVRLVPSWEQDTVPLPGPADVARAALRPDELTDRDVYHQFAEIVRRLPDVAARGRTHLPPDPPIMPGRPS